MKSILTALLLLLTVYLFTACNRTPQTEIPDDNRSVVFAGQTLALPDGWGFPYRPALTVTDDGLTMVQNGRAAQVCTDAEAAELPGRKVRFTQEWAEDFCAMLDGITRRHCTYRIPELLFREELFTESDRPAAEMLEILQSRVSVYLSEQFE